MRQPADYRTQAADCGRRAEVARIPRVRSILLQQAQVLDRLADEADAVNKTLLTGETPDKTSREVSQGDSRQKRGDVSWLMGLAG
jgi:hypothetical protein